MKVFEDKSKGMTDSQAFMSFIQFVEELAQV